MGSTSEGLRAAVSRARRPYRWTVAAWFGIAIMLPVLISLFLPAVAADAVGLTERVPGVVQSVTGEPRVDQPDKKVSWTVTVEWTDGQGVTHQAAEDVSAVKAPYRVGEQVEVGAFGDHATLRPASDAVWMLTLFLGFAAVCLVIALVYWRRSRAWSPLPQAVSGGRPDRSAVVGAGRPLRRRPSRYLPLEHGVVLPFRESGSTGSVFVLDRAAGNASASRMPQEGDELEIWDGARASAVHRPADGAWWVTGVDARNLDPDAPSEHKLSAGAKRWVIPLVLLGAFAVAAARWLIRDGMGLVGWTLFAAGSGSVIAAIVVMSRDRRRPAGRRREEKLRSFSE